MLASYKQRVSENVYFKILALIEKLSKPYTTFSYFRGLHISSVFIKKIYIFKITQHLDITVTGKRLLPNGPFSAFINDFEIFNGPFLIILHRLSGPFSKLMRLWCMAPCLPNHWYKLFSQNWQMVYYDAQKYLFREFITKCYKIFNSDRAAQNSTKHG